MCRGEVAPDSASSDPETSPTHDFRDTYPPGFNRHHADGHNYTRRSLRDRILVGMFAANTLFSVGMVVPIDLFDTSNDASCGAFAISGTTAIAALGFFLGGKFAMVLYELFMVGYGNFDIILDQFSRRSLSAPRACRVLCSTLSPC